jgi:hypothetical protein
MVTLPLAAPPIAAWLLLQPVTASATVMTATNTSNFIVSIPEGESIAVNF